MVRAGYRASSEGRPGLHMLDRVQEGIILAGGVWKGQLVYPMPRRVRGSFLLKDSLTSPTNSVLLLLEVLPGV